MKRTIDLLFYLIKESFSNGYTIDSKYKKMLADEEMLGRLYNIAKWHDLVHMLTEVLDSCGILENCNEKIVAAYQKQRVIAVYRYERTAKEVERISDLFESEGIDYILLKGAYLKRYYPKPWFRTSSDLDVFVDRSETDRAISLLQEKLGYTYEGKNTHDAQLWSSGGVNLELHFDLIEEYLSPISYKVIENVWDHTELIDGKRRGYFLDEETAYIYHLLHMAKHILNGGCGIRPFIDLWLMRYGNDFSREKCRDLVTRCEMTCFEDAVITLSEAWFACGEHTSVTHQLEEYILRGGVYGNFENKELVRRTDKGRLGYVFYRIFMPYDELCYIYPALANHKILYPYYTVKRWINRFRAGKFKKVVVQAKRVANLSDVEIKHTKQLISEI